MITLFDAMKKDVVKTIENAELDLIDVSDGQKKDEETGEIIPFWRYEVEIQKGYEEFSRCRFTVKIENGKTIITKRELMENYYTISFEGLEVSYVSEKGIVYFRASGAKVKKEEN